MLKTITVTVAYPVTFQIEVDDSESSEVITDKVLKKADHYLETTSIEAYILDSDMFRLCV